MVKTKKPGDASLPDVLDKLSLDSSLPQRPAYGTLGRPVTLWANYFDMTTNKDLILYRYHIEVLPQDKVVPVGKKLKRIIALLIEENLATLSNDIVSDYKTNLISRTELPASPGPFTIAYRGDGEDTPLPNGRSYQVKLTPLQSLTVGDLLDYLTSTNVSKMYGGKEPIIQALNIILGWHPKNDPNAFSVGANKHYPMNGETYNLGQGLNALRGIFVSVRAATGRLLLNVQVKHAACYQPGPLTGLLAAYGNNGDTLRLSKFLARLRVRVTHLKDKKNKAGKSILRFKTIVGLATPQDGQGMAHPPQVAAHGAGPKKVKFWLNSDSSSSTTPSGAAPAGKGKGKGPTPAGPQRASRYITVWDYFKDGKCTSTADSGVCADSPYTSAPTRSERLLSCRKRRHQAKSVLLTGGSLHRTARAGSKHQAQSRADRSND